MAEPWCDFNDLPKSECAHCRPPVDISAPMVTGPTIEASQSTPCDHCGSRIEPGDQITMTDEGWIHARHLGRQDGPPPTDTSTFDGIEI